MHYTISTINKKVNSLSSFNQFLILQDHCSEQSVYPNRDKIKVANSSESEVEVFSEKEAEQILFYLGDSKKVFASDLYKETKNIILVQKALGHSQIQITIFLRKL